jgi:PDZ domain-containing protein
MSFIQSAFDQVLAAEDRVVQAAEGLASEDGSSSTLQGVAARAAASSRDRRNQISAQRSQAVDQGGSGSAVVAALMELQGALSQAATGYAALHAIGHRAYDGPPADTTAGVAEAQLRSCAAQVRELNELISGLVIEQLGEQGLECACKCPGCSLGLCLCAAHGMGTVKTVWQESEAGVPVGGFVVRTPRSGSPAHAADLQAGDRITAVGETQIASDQQWLDLFVAVNSVPAGHDVNLTVDRSGQTFTVAVRRPDA